MFKNLLNCQIHWNPTSLSWLSVLADTSYVKDISYLNYINGFVLIWVFLYSVFGAFTGHYKQVTGFFR